MCVIPNTAVYPLYIMPYHTINAHAITPCVLIWASRVNGGSRYNSLNMRRHMSTQAVIACALMVWQNRLLPSDQLTTFGPTGFEPATSRLKT
jgi:hypothetical protein